MYVCMDGWMDEWMMHVLEPNLRGVKSTLLKFQEVSHFRENFIKISP